MEMNKDFFECHKGLVTEEGLQNIKILLLLQGIEKRYVNDGLIIFKRSDTSTQGITNKSQITKHTKVPTGIEGIS